MYESVLGVVKGAEVGFALRWCGNSMTLTSERIDFDAVTGTLGELLPMFGRVIPLFSDFGVTKFKFPLGSSH